MTHAERAIGLVGHHRAGRPICRDEAPDRGQTIFRGVAVKSMLVATPDSGTRCVPARLREHGGVSTIYRRPSTVARAPRWVKLLTRMTFSNFVRIPALPAI
ncbi:hypothetical protein [Methylobacterium sp. CM6257]